MVQGPSKRILLIGTDPADHAEFRKILCVDAEEGDAGHPQLPPILQDLQLDVVGQDTEGRMRVREAVQQGRPYLLAAVDLEGAGVLDGVEAVRCLWEEDPALPLLLCAGADCAGADCAGAGRRKISRRLGRIDRLLPLSKPFDPDEVRQAVAAQIDRRLARRELQEATGEFERALQRAREQAESAGRAKREFMANISHEIRTPMNAILGFTGLLMKEPLRADQLEKLTYIRNAGTSLLDLIDNVLDYSKLVAGELKLSVTAFALETLLTDVLQATRPAARAKGLALPCRIAEAVPRRLRGDKVRFRQVLVNLLGNAIKFTDHGTIYIQVGLDEQTDETATLRVVVTDTGVGIPVERQTIIFESFSQADGSSTRQFEGAGLGLSICKRLVDLMGGQIGFRSDQGQGSSFWLTITFEKQSSDDPNIPAEEKITPSPEETLEQDWDTSIQAPCGKPHVLVADDDQLNRTLAEMLLSRAGCLVDLAENGREALAMLQKTPYELVLMGIEMPERDGREAIEQVRHREDRTGRHVPIVALTACTLPGNRERWLAAGADECVSKPVTPEMLIHAVQHYLPGCLEASESATAAQRSAVSRRRPDSAHGLEDCLRALDEALAEESFVDMENSAARLRSLSQQSGEKPAADHAMRVQLAARCGDLKRVAAAIRNLRAALHDRPAPDTSPGLCPLEREDT